LDIPNGVWPLNRGVGRAYIREAAHFGSEFRGERREEMRREEAARLASREPGRLALLRLPLEHGGALEA
jgi:hypothetical protein